jgi:hypothetical protein
MMLKEVGVGPVTFTCTVVITSCGVGWPGDWATTGRTAKITNHTTSMRELNIEGSCTFTAAKGESVYAPFEAHKIGSSRM